MKKLINRFTAINLCITSVLLFVCIAATGQAQTVENDYKLRVDIPGVPGEGVGGSIEGAQYIYNLTTDTAVAGGASTSRAKFTPVVITKGIDSATPKLQTACASGQRLHQVQISFIRTNRAFKNGEQVFLRVVLEDVQITSVSTRMPKSSDAKSSLDSGEPYEEVGFSFGRITWIYTLPNGNTIREGWDVRMGREL